MFGVALLFSAVILIFGQTETSERACYLLVPVAVVPISVFCAWRSQDDEPEYVWLVGLETMAVTALALVVARLFGGSHASAWVVAALLIGRALVFLDTRRRVARPEWLQGSGPEIAIPILLAIAAVTCTSAGTVELGRVAIAAAIAAAVGLAALRIQLPSRRGRRLAIDIVAAVLVMLAVFELVNVASGGPAAYGNLIFFVGPTNDVLHGQAMLVQTYSQYGVGMFYALAAVFKVLPLGYGVFLLFIALATSLLYVCIYAVVRLSIRSQLLAILAVIAAVVVYIYAGAWQYVFYASTGVLRFGPAWLVVLCSVAETRALNPAAQGRLRVAQLVVVGVAVIWSGEVGMYCFGTAVAIAVLDCAAVDAPLRARAEAFMRRLLALVAAAVIALVVFSVLTRVFAGSWPNWGPYFSFIHEYTLGGLGLIAIPVWSPGIAVGAFYGVSAAVVVGMLVLGPSVIRDRMPAFRAIAGITVMGALEYTYFLGRAAGTNMVHVAAPVVTLAFLWMGVAGPALRERRAVAVLIAAASFLGVIVVGGDHRNFSPKFPETALGGLVEHPAATVSLFSLLAGNPSIEPISVRLDGFIKSLHPGERQLVLVAFSAIESEALIRSGRANAVGGSNPCQEEISPTAPDRVLKGVKELKAGSLLVTFYRRFNPRLRLSPHQKYELAVIRARFRTKQIARRGNFAAYTLVKQRASWHGGGSIKRPQAVVWPSSGCA